MEQLVQLPPPSPQLSGSPRPGAAAPEVAPPRNGRGRLEMVGIDKNFSADGKVPAVRGITLSCEPGEFVVVVGPSGCGKSTLLNVAAGMIKADAGEVSLDGTPVDGPGPERAMVFQDHGLFAWLTAEQNVDAQRVFARLGFRRTMSEMTREL